MSKFEELDMLKNDMEADAGLPFFGKANLVFGEGHPDAKVLFIGEAPGFYEDRERRPFVGRAGQLLNKMLLDIGWRRESVYITNIVKRRPPENRDPEPTEIEAYKPYLKRQLAVIQPKIIATLGRFSMNYFLPKAKISLDHGKVADFSAKGGSASGGKKYPLVYILYHPAAALRSTSVLLEFEKDFKRLPALLKRYERGSIKA